MHLVLIFTLLFLATALATHTNPDMYWHGFTAFGDIPTEPQAGAFSMLNSTHGVYFGGYDNSPCFSQSCSSVMSDKTHLLSQENSTHFRWTQVFPTSKPSARAVFSGYCTMTDDENEDVMFVFGGIDINTFATNGELWRYRISTNTWTLMSTSGPGARMSGFVACAHGKVWVFYGGIIDLSTFNFFTVNDVWAYSIEHNTWAQTNGNSPTPDNQTDNHIPPHQRYNAVGAWNRRVGKFPNGRGDELSPSDATVLNGIFFADPNGINPVTFEFIGTAVNCTLTVMRCDEKYCFIPFGDLGDGRLLCLAGTGNNDNPTNETVVINARRKTIGTLAVTHQSPALKAHAGDIWEKEDGSTHMIVVNGYGVSCFNTTTAVYTKNHFIYTLPTGIYHG